MSTEGLGLSGPEDVDSPAGLAEALSGLRHRLGLSVRDIAQATGIPASTLGGYFSGRHVPPLTQPQLYAELLRALRVPATDVVEWREALIRIRRRRG